VLHVPDAQLVWVGEVLENCPEMENPYLMAPELTIEMVNAQERSSSTEYVVPSPWIRLGVGLHPVIENSGIAPGDVVPWSTIGCSAKPEKSASSEAEHSIRIGAVTWFPV